MLGSSLVPCSASTLRPQPPIIRPRLRATATTTTTSGLGLHPVEPKPLCNTLHQVLRIKHNASQSEIKAAYRSLAKQYHPDASASSSLDIDFMQIHNAYATLSDPIARADYDMSVVASSSFSTSHISRCHPARTWETDQCW